MRSDFRDEMYIYDFSVRQRETFEQEITLRDDSGELIDLSGKSAAGEVRPAPGSNTLTKRMSCSVDVPRATITFGLTSAQTADIAAGNYAYDVCMIETVGSVQLRKYLIGGRFFVLPSVTQ